MKKILLSLLMLANVNSFAQWNDGKLTDDFTDEISYVPFVVGTGNDRTYNDPVLAYYPTYDQFAIIGAGYFIDDSVTIKIRIDNGNVSTVPVQIINNKSLLFSATPALVKELKNGNEVLMQESEDFNKMKFSLLGFTKAFNNSKNY